MDCLFIASIRVEDGEHSRGAELVREIPSAPDVFAEQFHSVANPALVQAIPDPRY